jgi:hypothetical protein
MSAGVAACVAVPLLFVVAVNTLIQRMSPGLCATTEEHEPMSIITIYPLIKEFSDFSQNDE